MKKCLACGATYHSTSSSCQSCGLEPHRIGGITAYSPKLNQGSEGFKTSYFADLAGLEAEHFWFRARNRLIVWAMSMYCPEFRSYLEIGCGTGYVLDGIATAYPGRQLHGSEIFSDGLAFACARQPTIDFMQMDARQIPFVDEYDAIGVFDVLEHIHEDEQVLMQIYDALHTGGVMLLTVPQHSCLWSPIDDYACHVRRYSAKELHEKVKNVGFEIVRSTSFVTTLLPAMFFSRMVQRREKSKNIDITDVLGISPWLNKLFEKILLVEIFLIRCGLNLPLGGSRLVIARKLL